VLKPRRFFQLHLSTALVLMVLAAGLLGANLTPRKVQIGPLPLLAWGWPYDFKLELERNVFERGVDASSVREGFRIDSVMEDTWRQRLTGNVAVALGILTLAAVLLEWRLRRRDNYKEAAHG